MELAPLAHVACIFYYPFPDQSASKAITNQLEKSFSETLTLFYPLAGRYAKEDLSVECNHKGGAFLEAQVSGELASVVNGGGDPKFFRRFLPLGVGEVDETKTPLVGVQVSVFKCGGLAVGVLLSHRIADAYTVATFMDAWAKVGRGASIASLKAKAGCHATRLEVVSALIWKALIAVSAKRGCLRPSLLVHSVNLRGKTGLPIPEIACGNFYMLATARFLARKEQKWSWQTWLAWWERQ
ncbi:hypothetical protein Acr_06g0013480 [Actinidia rufa]|uniref:HXXXD-type acyl-transferase family protein n=1 Tax=Actinidia rufa TaxID=165716 RepID=A0A7J0ESF8_9ERIC|nr:hypothetical protein Acr_06g0013480 [Actinidia rufa]